MEDRLTVKDRRITPTDLSQYFRLSQCDRYLRLRLHHRTAKLSFFKAHDIAPESVPPLLSRSGRAFESEIERLLRERFALTVHFGEEASVPERAPDNVRLRERIVRLPSGETLLALQPRLEAEANGWIIEGDADLLLIERDESGKLSILVADIKSSDSPKVEHRLQVAFYREMLLRLLGGELEPDRAEIAVLYRGSLSTPEERWEEKERDDREAIKRRLGLERGFLEVVADRTAYEMSVEDLVTRHGSTADRVADAAFDDLFFHLGFKCDGCLYNAFCMKECRETDDLSLLPAIAARDKKTLGRAGYGTIHELAAVKTLVKEGSGWKLAPAPGHEERLASLSAESVGPVLDDLIFRAKKKTGEKTPSYLASSGPTSLPYSDAVTHPNLILLLLDAQRDFLNDRLYLIGTRILAYRDGKPGAPRSVVRMTPHPPEDDEAEAALLLDWIGGTLAAVDEMAAPDASGKRKAPIHLVFWNAQEQRVLLEGLSRHLHRMAEAIPAIYDFIAQSAAFDSPVATFLEAEIRDHKNYPLTFLSLQATARYLGFKWNEGTDYPDLFRERLFDESGREGEAFVSKRSRFGSSIPLEYAYAAWDELPKPEKRDEYRSYRRVTMPLLIGFQERRLAAMERVMRDLPPNRGIRKSDFDLENLASAGRKGTLADALEEFLLIERHESLAEWKARRYPSPDRRVLSGESLLVRFQKEDQKGYMPEKTRQGLRLRLRAEAGEAGCDLETALDLFAYGEESRFLLMPTLVPPMNPSPENSAERPPTPSQMLYGARATLLSIEAEKSDDGRVLRAFAEVEMGLNLRGTEGFVFAGIDQELKDGRLYSLEPDPNDWSGANALAVVRGAKALLGERGDEAARDRVPHALYGRLARPSEAAAPGDPRFAEGQRRFLDGLLALRDAGEFHDLEASKLDYIGGNGAAPFLLVQGPPGTGKSYSTAYAIFARLQGAIRADEELRVFLSCKTHAATDVLLEAARKVRDRLRAWKDRRPDLWERFFRDELLSVPLFRVYPENDPSEGVIKIPKKEDLKPGEKSAILQFSSHPRLVAAATPGGLFGVIRDRFTRKSLFGHHFCDLLVLDEASQMSLPEALMASLPLKPDGRMIVVGDPRQMPPIVRHDWETEPGRAFQEYRIYESLYETIHALKPPRIAFSESFRLHRTMAEFLRKAIYQQDGIPYFSRNASRLEPIPVEDGFVRAVLSPDHPLVAVTHGEAGSQKRNDFERDLIAPTVRLLMDSEGYGLDAAKGLGVVVPHRAQRSALKKLFPDLAGAVDVVERYQGDEREAILICATESDRDYLQDAGEFLLNPRRLTVALSRGKRKMILVASETIFAFHSGDERLFLNGCLWKRLLRKECREELWRGEFEGNRVVVWGSAGEGE